jgi:putative transposase
MILSEIGLIVQNEWLDLPKIRKSILLDEYIIMPNHIHCIFLINIEPDFQQPLHYDDDPILYPNSVGSIIGGYKAGVTRQCRLLLDNQKIDIWHRNYYDHIIRNEDDLNHCREYIIQNPASWHKDEMFI